MLKNPLQKYAWSFHDDHSMIWRDFDLQRVLMMGIFTNAECCYMKLCINAISWRLFPHYGSHSSSKDYCCLLPLISQNNNDCGVFPPITSHNRSVSDIFLDSHKPPTTHIKFTTIVYHLIYIWSKNSWFLKKILFWCNFHNSQRLQGDIVDMYKWHWWRYTLDKSEAKTIFQRQVAHVCHVFCWLIGVYIVVCAACLGLIPVHY